MIKRKEWHETAIELYNEGHRAKVICAVTGVSKTTVNNFLYRYRQEQGILNSCEQCGAGLPIAARSNRNFCGPQCWDVYFKLRDLKQANQTARHPINIMLKTAKHRAKRKQLDFDLKFEDIYLPEYCPALNIKLEFNYGKGQTGGEDNSYSLDRIDSAKGYTPDNIQVLSRKANAMKNNATKEELISFAKWILEVYSE